MAPQTNRWAEFWPGADLDAMAADVDRRGRAALAAWNLRDAEVLLGGHVALVVATTDRVVKVNPRGHPDEEELRGEAEALQRWRATGAVVDVLDTRDDGLTLLLERLGSSLHEATLAWEEKLTIVGGLVRRLHAAGDLLHYDLHVRNVLRARDGWKAIDPKGVHGDPHDDVWALLSPEAPPARDGATFRRWAAIYADAAGLDLDGVLAGVERRRWRE